MDTNKDLTALTLSYKIKATLAVLAILLFFLLFAALVAGFALLTYYSITYEMVFINQWTIIGKIGAIAGSLMLLVFSLKFLFKLRNHKPENRIKVTQKNHPELWDFVFEICEATGAPKPKNIYVDPDVNAYVAYSNSWLSLFLPVRKELTIGMALVDCLNTSEFRAVVAHEFGHFAQRSMKIGSYIMSANTIIHDMIFNRDRWDRLLEQWRGTDFRLSFAAWIITPVIWAIRQLLNLFYLLLNLMYSSLSREMEFNADKVAVSLSGSDAILSALWKLDNGSEKWNGTLNNAYLAAQKKIFTDDLYFHNRLALEKSQKAVAQVYQELEPDPRGGTLFFKTSENSKTGMYASHPPNDKRQDNAKTPFIKGEVNHKSPWEIFGDTSALKKEMTALIYEKYLSKEKVENISRDSFQHFVDTEETSSGELEAVYDNTFANRLLEIPDAFLIERNAGSDTSLGTLDTLKQEVKELMKPVKELEGLMRTAEQIAQRTTKERFVHFDGKKYGRKNLNEVYEKIVNAHTKLMSESFREWDARFCLLHLSLCNTDEDRGQLVALYEQHRVIFEIFKQVLRSKEVILKDLQQVQSNQELTEHQLLDFGRDVQLHMLQFNDSIVKIDAVKFVPLPNIESAIDFKNAIIEGGKFEEEPGKIFENGGFDRIMQRLEQTIGHLNRIHAKSVYKILAEQQKIVEKAA